MGTEMGKNSNENKVLSWEWVGMGMTSWDWEGMGTVKVIPAHLYRQNHTKSWPRPLFASDLQDASGLGLGINDCTRSPQNLCVFVRFI